MAIFLMQKTKCFLAYTVKKDIVAEQRASYLFGKSPKMYGWKIYVICHTSYFASPVLTLLLNTSRSLLLLRIICLVSTLSLFQVFLGSLEDWWYGIPTNLPKISDRRSPH